MSCLSPLPFSMFSHRCIFNSIVILLLGLRALPQSTKGISARGYHSLLANPREKWATVSFSLVLLFHPPIPNVFSWVHFQLNCYFAASVGGPPSVHKGNESPPLLSPACKSHREAGDSEFISCLSFPTHSQCFLTGAFSIKLLFCCRC